MTDILLAIIAGLLLYQITEKADDFEEVILPFVMSILVGAMFYAIAYGVQLILRHVGVT